jgi:hypothetical protein
MSEAFVYLPEWRVVLCTLCSHCLQPWPDVWTSHLRQQPHSLRAAQLKSLKELFGSYDLAAPDEVGVPKQNGEALCSFRGRDVNRNDSKNSKDDWCRIFGMEGHLSA